MKDQLGKFQKTLIKGIGVDKYVEQFFRTGNLDLKTFQGNSRLDEYKVWYSGDEREIEAFYKRSFMNGMYPSNQFWRVVNTNIPKVHYPIASTISNTFGSLLFSQLPEIRVEDRSQKRTEQLTQLLEEFLDENDMLNVLQEAAQKQSYSGGVALKLNIDPTLSEFPLITIYPKEDYEVHTKYNRIVYIDFKDTITIDKEDYILISRYGRGYITYTLYNSKGDEIPKHLFAETADLKDIVFYNKEGNQISDVFATVIKNNATGRSDYDGLITLFHTLDEITSSMADYIRKSKTRTMVSESLMERDANDNLIMPHDFDMNFTLFNQPRTAQGAADPIYERTIHDPVVAGFIEAQNAVLQQILVRVGLSPATIGLSVGGARESSEALEIRERTSSRTRANKLSVWKEGLEDFIYSALLLTLIMNDSDYDIETGIVQINTQHTFSVKITFGDYNVDTLDSRAKLNMQLYKEGMIPIGFAQANIFENLTDEQLKLLTILTKLEHDIPLNELEQEVVSDVKFTRKIKNTNI